MSADAYLTDQFLIAMPALQDGPFGRSVSYVCRHNAEGAMALVINRAAGFALGEVLEELGMPTQDAAIAATPVLIGGPVQPERGFVLHGDDGRDWDASLALRPGLRLTTSRDVLAAIAAGTPPRPWLFALGYAGWGAGQLERELLDNAWLTGPADPAICFELPVEQRLQAAAGALGVDLSRLSGYAGHA